VVKPGRRTLLVAAAAALAAPAAPARERPAAPGWIALDAAELRRVLPPPPADESLAGRADLEVVLMWQALRSDAQQAEGVSDASRGALEWAQWAWPAFDPARQPITAELLALLQEDLRPIIRAANEAWGARAWPAATG
jgi:hypothetical protein